MGDDSIDAIMPTDEKFNPPPPQEETIGRPQAAKTQIPLRKEVLGVQSKLGSMYSCKTLLRHIKIMRIETSRLSALFLQGRKYIQYSVHRRSATLFSS